MAAITKMGGSTLYQVDKEEQLTCPKCGKEVDYLLGEGKWQACESCYNSVQAPPVVPDPGERISGPGENNNPSQIKPGRIDIPAASTQAEQLDEMLKGNL